MPETPLVMSADVADLNLNMLRPAVLHALQGCPVGISCNDPAQPDSIDVRIQLSFFASVLTWLNCVSYQGSTSDVVSEPCRSLVSGGHTASATLRGRPTTPTCWLV